ncbi:hypothetical protein MPER_10212 [Moniliophthora perniciosa FA553]|nr:hypothetical protein MPER_10212 [Moniliophthora perniciosa FA553]
MFRLNVELERSGGVSNAVSTDVWKWAKPSRPATAPLPTVNVASSDILVTPPSNVALKSTLSMATAYLPLPVVMIFLTLTCLYILVPRIFDWRYPCQSVDPLLVLSRDIERLIFENTSVTVVTVIESAGARKCELGLLMRRLRIIHARVKALKAKSRAGPPRSNVLAWVVFRWSMIKEIDEWHVALTILDAEVQAKLERCEEGEGTFGTDSTYLCILARNRTRAGVDV